MNLDPILAEMLDTSTKGYPLSSPATAISAIGARRWSVLAGDLPLPLAVIRDAALAHNHAWMRDFTASTGVLLAPHGKTTMAPQIFAQQLEAGAWGITVANVQQLGICARFGIRRVIMANQLLGAAEVATVIRLREAHPDLEFHFLIDSPAQLAAIEAAAAERTMSRKLTALVELGVPGGRTGCRTFDEAMTVARAIAASRIVALSGLECYEGLQVNGDSARDVAMVGALMQRVKDVALACDAEKSVHRHVDHPHRGRLGGVRHRCARTADTPFPAGADDPAQRLLRYARLRFLQSHARASQGAQWRHVANACGSAAGARSVVARAIVS